MHARGCVCREGGHGWQGGMRVQGVCMLRGHVWHARPPQCTPSPATHAPVNRITDACENITGRTGGKNILFFLNITVHNHWSVIKVRGKGPRPRRRQCCCPINGRVFLFGGTRLLLSSSSSYSKCDKSHLQ